MEIITEADLHHLKDEIETESRRIDYKSALVLDTEEAKAEFRRDVSSFANGVGGDIIVGIRDNKGVPEEVCGFDIGTQTEEQYKLRLLEILQSRIKPRIQNVQIRPFQLINNKWATIIRIPNSFAKPHQVEVGSKGFEFWLRYDGGKQRMDLDELRDAILLTESFGDRIRTHRTERVQALKNGATPVMIQSGPKTMLHFIPLDAFRSRENYNLKPVEQYGRWPRPYSGFTFYNFDGVVRSNRNFDGDKEIAGRNYTLFTRNGIVEAVEGYRFMNNERTIPTYHFQTTLLDDIPVFTEIMQRMGVQPPIALLLSLVGVKGYCLQYDQTFYAREAYRMIDREDLLMPEVVLQEFTADKQALATLMRPVFDMLWQAANFRWCPYYDEVGVWMPDKLSTSRLGEAMP